MVAAALRRQPRGAATRTTRRLSAPWVGARRGGRLTSSTTERKAESNDPPRHVEAPCCPDGALERLSLEDRDVRLARVRRRGARDRKRRRYEEHRSGEDGP